MAVTYTSKLVTRTPQSVGGFDVIPFRVELPSDAFDTDDDSVLLLKFGPNTRLPVGPLGANALTIYWDDLDTNATETLDLDIGIGDSDGTLDTTLINSGTAWEDAGGPDYVDAAVANGTIANAGMIDVSDKYLILHANTKAATPAAGTVAGTVVVCNNALELVDDLTV